MITQSVDRVIGLLNILVINKDRSISITIINLLYTDKCLAQQYIRKVYGMDYTLTELQHVQNLLEQEGKWN